MLKRRGTWETHTETQDIQNVHLNSYFHFFLSSIPLLLSVWTIQVAFLLFEFFHILLFFVFICHVFFLFCFICARGLSENWRYCSVTSSDSVTPRRFSTTPTTRCCLGCGPTAPPTCRGTGTHPATSHSLTVHPDRWHKVYPYSCTHADQNIQQVHKKNPGFRSFSAWTCCVSNNVSLTLIWDHCVAGPPWLLCIFVCLAHTFAISTASRCSLTGCLFLSPSFFPFISITPFPCRPPSILHLFSGRQKFHAGLFFKSRAVLVGLKGYPYS